MVETQDMEVYSLEISMATEPVIGVLAQNGAAEVVLLDGGAYVGVYSTDKHKVMTGKIYLGGVFLISGLQESFFLLWKAGGNAWRWLTVVGRC